MKRISNFGLRKYISENLAKGYSAEQIESALLSQGYEEKAAKAILADYSQHASIKGRLISNNILAAMVILFVLASVISNYFILTMPSHIKFTGMAFSTATGTASMCINTQPEIDISNCKTEANVSEEYSCTVYANDSNLVYTPLMIMLYFDNTSLFNITKIDNLEARINFTPEYPAALGGYNYTQKRYDIELKVSDNSGCDNENASAVLSLLIRKGCSVKQPPAFQNLNSNYTIPRNIEWTLDVNATDVDLEDSITYYISEINYSAFRSFNSTNSIKFSSTTGLLNITPRIVHLNSEKNGWHLLNITAKDNSSCTNNNATMLVNVTVDANNNIPVYIGGPGDLDKTWSEDITLYNVYNLDDYFNDTDGDCLKYEVENNSIGGFIDVIIDNNVDPRLYDCPPSHYVTLNPAPNQFGEQIVCFMANDTINVSEKVCAKLTVNNVPELIQMPPSSSVSAPAAGGGAGPAGPTKRCEEKWYCGKWGNCIDGYMSRNCTDMNNCRTRKFKPNETEACAFIPHCNDGLQNYDEEGVDCGGECPAKCATCYDAIMNCHTLQDGTSLCEEGVDCGGPCDKCKKEEEVAITVEHLGPEKAAPKPQISPIQYYAAIIGASALALTGLLFAIRFVAARKKKSKKKEIEAKEKPEGKPEQPKREKVSLKEFLNRIFSFRHRKLEERRHAVKKPKEVHPVEKERKLPRVISRLKEWLSSKAEEKAGKALPEVSETISKLNHLLQQIGKESNEKIIRQLGQIMREWLKSKFNVEHEATFEELSQQAREKNREQMLNSRIKPFFEKLIDAEYSGKELSDNDLRGLINHAINVIDLRRHKIGHRLESEDKQPAKPKPKGSPKKIAAALLFILLFAGTMLFMFKPEITGRVVQEKGLSILSINKSFTAGDTYTLDLAPKQLTAFKLSGEISRNADIKIYLGKEDDNYLVLGSSILSADINKSRQIVHTDEIKQFAERIKDIDLKLNYNYAPPFEDNDGIAPIEMPLSFTVKDSLFSWSIDKNKLCTLWEISNEESTNYACYGSYDCCSFIDLLPERDIWDDTFYLNYGKYGAIENNIVSAKLIYANYSISLENPYSEIIESETENISAIFEKENVEFRNVCINTCSTTGIKDNKLIIKGTGKVFISNAAYALRGIIANSAPEFKAMPNITIGKNKNYSIDLSEYASDKDNDGLEFTAYESDELSVIIAGSFAKLVPKQDSTGKAYTFFTANDSLAIGISNIIEVNVVGGLPSAEEVSEFKPESSVEINKDVKWKKRIKVENISNEIIINISRYGKDIGVAKIINGNAINVSENNIDVIDNNLRKPLPAYEGQLQAKQPQPVSQPKKKAPAETSASTEADIALAVKDPSPEMEISYVTDGPISQEISISAFRKIINISSDVHYTNILSYSDVTEVKKENVKLYWLVNNSRVQVKDITYADQNNNGLIDRIYWNVPSLSSEVYEIEITILNVQSYPTVGGNWTVMFTTVGAANLTITPINGTRWSNSQDTGYDLRFLELKCGNNSIDYQWLGENCDINACSAFVENYSCSDTAYETSRVLTPGTHNLMFQFADQTAYANNYASVAAGLTNLTIWDDTDSDSSLKATDTIRFYANYTNGTAIANGTCTIKFNLTGDWQNETNMTYNGDSLPWNYSRTIPYKGTTYFNVLCQNSSMNTLNATDSISIANTQPSFLSFGTIYVTEDTPYILNISRNVSDPDLNDIFSYGYVYPPGISQSLFTFDSTNGIVNISATTSSNAGTYNLSVVVRDSSLAEGIDRVNITITAVNDYPVITAPSGNSLTNAVVNNGTYIYNITATDEEDAVLSNYNFTITWCNRSYVSNCDGTSIDMNRTIGRFNFTPQHDDTGNYTLNISVTDSNNATTWKLVNLSIVDTNVPPYFEYVCNSSRSAIEDVLFNCTINATDPNHDALNFTANASWFNLSSVPGKNYEVLANFTPLNQHVGNHTINISVTDGTYSVSTLINFTVNNTNDAPTLASITGQTAIVSREFTYYETASDDDFWQPGNRFNNNSENLAFSINTTFITISKYNATTAKLNFTPTEGQRGNYTIEVNVTDSSNANYTLTFNLTIRNNTAPSFDWLCNGSGIAQEDSLFTCIVNATDLEGDSFNYTSNQTWFLINLTTGNVSFTANDSAVGNRSILINATDIWGANRTAIIWLFVNNTPEAPVLTIVNLTATQNITLIYNLSKNVTDEDMNAPGGDNLTYSWNASFVGSYSLNASTGIINFTPDNSDVGVKHLNITVIDSYGLRDSKIINITILNVNDPPIINYWCQNDTTSLEDTLYTCQVNATDVDTGAVLNYSADVVGETDWFSISSSTGLVNFTPLNAHVGNHTINISVSDGIATAFKLLNFTVNNTNDAPVLSVIPNLNATEDSLFNYNLTASDDDFWQPDNTYNSVSEELTFATNFTYFIPSFNLTKLGDLTSVITFTPNYTLVGNYTIRFNVTDRAGAYSERIINFTIYAFNDPPVLQNISNFTIDEGQAFYYDVNASDEEDNESSLIFWTNDTSMFIINATTGVISFTPNVSMIGNHTINLTVNDTGGKSDSKIFVMTIRERNYPPNITQIMPYGNLTTGETFFTFTSRQQYTSNLTSITLYENTTIVFNITVTDANGDSLNTSWYKDGVLIYSTNSTSNPYYNYSINFSQQGSHNITVNVSDNRGMNDSFTWNITVVNVNRKPVFGTIEHNSYSQFSSGTNNMTNLTSTGILLAISGSSYYTYGEFSSASINIGPLFTSFYTPLAFTNISWNAVTPAGTNVSMQTRTSFNNVNWGNWSGDQFGRNYLNSTGEQVLSQNATYIQYKAVLQTSDNSLTPNLTSVKIEYILPDLNLSQGNMNANWIDLDDYFHDLDAEDSLTYSVSNSSHLTLSINNITHTVSITAPSDWSGNEVIYFTANDSYTTTTSNNLTVRVISKQLVSAVEYVYITTSRTVVRTRTRTVTEPRSLELLVPKHVAAFSEDTVVAPLILKNNGEIALDDIGLKAVPSSDKVQVYFSKDRVASLAPGETKEEKLYIRWKGTIDEFDISVNATSTEPEFSDSAIISVTGVSRIESNRTQIEEKEISFVRDLLSNNPECLELTELLLQADKSLKEGDIAKTRTTLNFVIDGCRYLISARKETEKPAPISRVEGNMFKIISGLLLFLLFIAVLIIYSLAMRKRRYGY